MPNTNIKSTDFNPALIVVDLQEDFLPPTGSLAVANGREVIPAIIELMDTSKYKWKAIVATKDWHPSDHISFASYHKMKPYETIMIDHPLGEKDPATGKVLQKLQVLWPDHCVQGTPGSDFPPEFEPTWEKLEKSKDIATALVKKGYLQDREYYSCFQDIWKLHHTECEGFLKQNNITHVFTVGIAYDFCVLNSSLDSASAGFKTYVIKECSKGVYPDKTDDTDKIYTDNGVEVISLASPILAKVTE